MEWTRFASIFTISTIFCYVLVDSLIVLAYIFLQMKHSNAAVSLVDLFTSDSYRLLHLLSELQTETIEGARIRESQDEIAELLGVSKGKLNPLMQGLMSVDCIEKYKARSGYVLTERGRAVLDAIERLKDL